MAEKFMQKARERMEEEGTVGKFSRMAKKKGMGTQALAKKEYHAKGKLGKEARFAYIAKHKHGMGK